MTNGKPVLVIPKTATREQLVNVLDRLAGRGLVSVKEVNETLEEVTLETRKHIDSAIVTKQRIVKELSLEQEEKLLKTLEDRFLNNMKRHPGINWELVWERLSLETAPDKLWSLNEMERTGGEPDVVGFDQKTGEYIFEDRSAESPKGRRNIVYDKAGEKQLKRGYPNEICAGNMVDMAAAMGIVPQDKERYLAAQEEEKGASGRYMDRGTSSWIETPVDKRESGVALFGHCIDHGVALDATDPCVRGDRMAFRGSLRV